MKHKQGLGHACLRIALIITGPIICSFFSTPTVTRAQVVQKFNGKIAFTSDRDSLLRDIVTINSDGSGFTRLTDDQTPNQQFGGTNDFSPAWSPDGAKLAYVSDREGSLVQIFSMNADGTNVKRLSDNTISESDPAWSPDGSRIAFTRGNCIPTIGLGKVAIDQTQPPCTPFVYSMNVDGSNRVNLSQIVGFGPVWSPNGSKIAFSSFDQDFNIDIFIMNSDGSNRIQLTNTAADDVVTSWSPDGTKLLFTSTRDAQNSFFLTEIYSMKIDGTNIIRLTNNQMEAQRGVFSPDGTKIAFQRRRAFAEDQILEIFVMNADGSNQTDITNSSSEDLGPPAWQSLSSPLQVPPPALLQFDAASYSVSESKTSLQINVLRTGDTAEEISVRFESDNETASEGSDYTRIFGTLHFAPGETSKGVTVLLNEDALVEGTETFSINLRDLTGNTALGNAGSAVISILDNDVVPPTSNPLDNTEFFVRQHYHDFLNREPDPVGLAFWINNIDSCGSNAACREVKRIDTSAAFFLSIEYQNTGFYVLRLWLASIQRLPIYPEFIRDTQEISRDLIVGAPGWEEKMDQNTQRFTEQFVSRPSFRRRLPETLTAEQYVDLLYINLALGPPPGPPSAERAEAIAAFGSGDTAGRARALRIIANNATFSERLFTSGFVTEEYFGYLRRDFDFAGFSFWHQKLDSFNGDFRNAEMVKAFLNSTEYRSRFGPP
jgi:Tol biopolymer transport system component